MLAISPYIHELLTVNILKGLSPIQAVMTVIRGAKSTNTLNIENCQTFSDKITSIFSQRH